MIIWLASYPKSGNTWVRVFLNSLFYTDNNESDINNLSIGQFPNRKHFKDITKNMDDINEFSKHCINAQSKLNLSNQKIFLKTHHAYWRNGNYKFTDTENTLGVIYIVRDPRNIITSLKNHYNFENYDDALKFLLDDRKVIGTKSSEKEVDLPHIISSWKNHFNSWKKMKKNYLLIKYENLIKSPNSEFYKIVNYIKKHTNFKFNEQEVKIAIDSCNFKNLKKQETTNGFVEAPKNTMNKFFYLGPDNNWENLLNFKIKNDIEINFKNEMKELNYL